MNKTTIAPQRAPTFCRAFYRRKILYLLESYLVFKINKLLICFKRFLPAMFLRPDNWSLYRNAEPFNNSSRRQHRSDYCYQHIYMFSLLSFSLGSYRMYCKIIFTVWRSKGKFVHECNSFSRKTSGTLQSAISQVTIIMPINFNFLKIFFTAQPKSRNLLFESKL